MVGDGRYTGVLDRFEDGQAVLVLARDAEDVADYSIRRDRVPEEGRHQDAVFDVAIDDGELVALEYDPDATSRRREQAQERFDRLSKRPSRDEE